MKTLIEIRNEEPHKTLKYIPYIRDDRLIIGYRSYISRSADGGHFVLSSSAITSDFIKGIDPMACDGATSAYLMTLDLLTIFAKCGYMITDAETIDTYLLSMGGQRMHAILGTLCLSEYGIAMKMPERCLSFQLNSGRTYLFYEGSICGVTYRMPGEPPCIAKISVPDIFSDIRKELRARIIQGLFEFLIAFSSKGVQRHNTADYKLHTFPERKAFQQLCFWQQDSEPN